MKNPSKTANLIIKLSQNLKIPFSIKTRTGFSKNSKESRLQTLVKISPFVKIITIHWRTYTQWHSWEVDRDFIYRLKEKVKTQTTIIGNGGVLSYQEAINKKQNLDWIAIWRWAIWNPWIITPHQPWWEEKKETMIRHLTLMKKIEDYTNSHLNYNLHPSLQEVLNSPSLSKNKATIEFRKYFMNYIKNHPQAAKLRTKISKIYNIEELKKFLSSI